MRVPIIHLFTNTLLPACKAGYMESEGIWKVVKVVT